MVGAVPIPGTNGNLGYSGYGPLTPVPPPSGGYTTNPDPRLLSSSVYYQPQLGIMYLSGSKADGFIVGNGKTFFDGYNVVNQMVGSPITTAMLNGVDQTIRELDAYAMNQAGLSPIDPTINWTDDTLYAQAPNTMMAPQMGMGWPQGQGQAGAPIQMRGFNQPM